MDLNLPSYHGQQICADLARSSQEYRPDRARGFSGAGPGYVRRASPFYLGNSEIREKDNNRAQNCYRSREMSAR